MNDKQIFVIKNEINSPEAYVDFQAFEIKDKINYEKELFLDWSGIDTCTTAFWNVILSGYIGIINTIDELKTHLNLKGVKDNDVVEFAYRDAKDLLKSKLENMGK